MGSEWLQLIGTSIMGVFFSFLVANLIAIVTAVKDDNLTDAISPTRSPASIVSNPDPVSLRPADSLTISNVTTSDKSIVVENDASLGNEDGGIDWVDVWSDLDEEVTTHATSKSSQVQAGRITSSGWVMF